MSIHSLKFYIRLINGKGMHYNMRTALYHYTPKYYKKKLALFKALNQRSMRVNIFTSLDFTIEFSFPGPL